MQAWLRNHSHSRLYRTCRTLECDLLRLDLQERRCLHWLRSPLGLVSEVPKEVLCLQGPPRVSHPPRRLRLLPVRNWHLH